jgi:hypothetical protein
MSGTLGAGMSFLDRLLGRTPPSNRSASTRQKQVSTAKESFDAALAYASQLQWRIREQLPQEVLDQLISGAILVSMSGDPSALESYKALVRELQMYSGEYVVDALAKSNDPKAISALVELLQQDLLQVINVENRIIKILVDRTDPRIIAILRQRLPGRSYGIMGTEGFTGTVSALKDYGGEQAAQALISYLDDNNRNFHRQEWRVGCVVSALGEMRYAGAASSMVEAFKYRPDEGNMDRTIIDALAKIAPASVEPLVTAMLTHKDATVRALSARALGEIGDSSIVNNLLKAATADKLVSRQAVTALHEVMQRNSSRVDMKSLEAISNLEGLAGIDYEYHEEWIGGRLDHEWLSQKDATVDCAQLRTLAREEMARRSTGNTTKQDNAS